MFGCDLFHIVCAFSLWSITNANIYRHKIVCWLLGVYCTAIFVNECVHWLRKKSRERTGMNWRKCICFYFLKKNYCSVRVGVREWIWKMRSIVQAYTCGGCYIDGRYIMLETEGRQPSLHSGRIKIKSYYPSEQWLNTEHWQTLADSLALFNFYFFFQLFVIVFPKLFMRPYLFLLTQVERVNECHISTYVCMTYSMCEYIFGHCECYANKSFLIEVTLSYIQVFIPYIL